MRAYRATASLKKVPHATGWVRWRGLVCCGGSWRRGRGGGRGAGPIGQAARTDMNQAPGDGRHRRRHGRRPLPVERIAAVLTTTQAPAALHRLPEVFLVGEALQTWPQMDIPVEFQLCDEQSTPVKRHRLPLHLACAIPTTEVNHPPPESPLLFPIENLRRGLRA